MVPEDLCALLVQLSLEFHHFLSLPSDPPDQHSLHVCVVVREDGGGIIEHNIIVIRKLLYLPVYHLLDFHN